MIGAALDLEPLLSGACPSPGQVRCGGPGAQLATVEPASPAELAATVRALRAAQVPWTLGPLPATCEPRRPVVVLSLRRTNRVAPIAPDAALVQAEGGVRLATLARLLRAAGLHADPLPAADLRLAEALLGPQAWLAPPGLRRPCLAERVVSLSVVLPDGSLLHTPAAPRRATGPDLAALLLGSRGRLGLIVGATLRVDRMPERRSELGFRLSDEATARRVALRLAHGFLPLTALARDEARLSLRLSGSADRVAAAEAALRRILSEEGEPAPVRATPQGLEPRLAEAPAPSPMLRELSERLRRVLDPGHLLLGPEELGQEG